jgi:hypothetical protein
MFGVSVIGPHIRGANKLDKLGRKEAQRYV